MFSLLFKDFTRIFRNYARIFDISKLLGVCLHSLNHRLLHHCLARFTARVIVI